MIDKTQPESPDPDIDAPDTTDAEQADNDSPGRLIRQARERVQMSLDELAAQTKLSHGVLDALERDDFKTLREPVYVRGYYRKCCKSLKLSEATLIAAYQRMPGSAGPAMPSKLLLVPENEMFGSRGAGSLRWWVGLIIVIAVLAAVYGYLYSRSNPAVVSPSATLKSNAVPTVAGNAMAVAVAVMATPTPAASSTAAAPTDKQADTMSSPVVAAPAIPAETQSLTLIFDKASWVRVESSTGKLLLSGVIQAGAKQVLTGKPPYSVFLGNAPGVIVEYAGNAFNVQPFVKSNSSARFNVPQG